MIRVRAARPADADAIAAIYAPHVLHGVASFEEEAPDPAAMARRIAGDDDPYLWLVAADETDGPVAYAYAAAFHARAAYRWTVETSVYVGEAARARGIGRLLYGALIATLVDRGFAQAVARISLPGDASVALHEAMGFVPVGVQRGVGYKHGRWIDVGLWQRSLAHPACPPRNPRRTPIAGQPASG